MLDGDIQIVAHLWLGLHCLDQLHGDLLGIAVQDPYPLDAANAAKLMEQLWKRLLPVQVHPVDRGFLGHQDQLLHSGPGQIPGLLNKVQFFHGNAPISPPDLWDHAVRAVFVAPFGDL